MKPDGPDVSLPSPVESEVSSRAEWVLCIFIAMLCYLFTCSFSSSGPQVASSNGGSVMLMPCPDPTLAEYYEDLPILPYVFSFDFCLSTCLSFVYLSVMYVRSSPSQGVLTLSGHNLSQSADVWPLRPGG